MYVDRLDELVGVALRQAGFVGIGVDADSERDGRENTL
jgi:hypothetical protein